MNSRRMAILLIVCGIVSSCANLNSVHRELRVSEGSGVLVDIKQRGIFVSKKPTPPGGVIVCAEPSPDSLSAYAAELVAKADLPKGAVAQLSSAFQESASFTGLRTQSIQLLRDSQYRICEAFMNGAIDKFQYDLLSRRYQKQTVALLAIEQLTGAIRSPSVTINTTGSAEAAGSISEIRDDLARIDKVIADLEVKKNREGLSADDKQAIGDDIEVLKSVNEAIQKRINNVRDALGSGSATSAVSPTAIPQPSGQNITEVARTVENIVKSITDTDDLGQLCFNYLQQEENSLKMDEALREACNETFKLDLDLKKQQLEIIKAAIANPTKAENLRKWFDLSEGLETGTKGKTPSIPDPNSSE